MNANFKVLLASLVVALAGCGVPDGKVLGNCDYKGFHIQTEHALTAHYCEFVGYQIEYAKKALDTRGLVSAEDFDKTFTNQNIRVHATDCFQAFGHSVEGSNDFLGGDIDIGVTGQALVHELLHVWDSKHFKIFTSNHAGWDKNGYYDADNYFSATAFHIDWDPATKHGQPANTCFSN